MENHIKKTWWKEGIVYQIYPRSFNDSNGDGIGDLRGVIEKLDYLKDLGIDILWLCPIYKSPNDDNGYDVSDYRAISEEFGTMDDLDELLEGLHQRRIKLVMDLVVNHSSDEHKWFEEAKKSKDSPYRDYYIWKKGKDGGPPNNWISFFGGSAWEYDELSEEYYLHLFSKKQPDLNWENEKLRQEIYEMMDFWLKKGVDGFRMDVIPFISKYQNFPDIDDDDIFKAMNEIYANGPRIHEFLKEMNKKVLSRYDVMTVGEATGVNPEQGLLYVGEDRQELNMIFHFGHMFMDSGPKGKYDTIPTDLNDFKNVFSLWEEAIGNKGWNSIFLGNHDFPRAVSRFGDDKEFLNESAKLIATLIFTMRGTPYIYQGDEIGMKNVNFKDISELNDIDGINFYQESINNGTSHKEIMKRINIHGRDHARTPIQWSQEDYAGFSTVQPWLAVNANFKSINVEKALREESSVLKFYQKMIKFRKKNPVLVYGDYRQLDNGHSKLFIYDRKLDEDQFRIILNFSSDSVKIPLKMESNCDLLVSNYRGELIDPDKMRAWEARVYKIN